jgi:hypothetical protein
MKIIVISNSMVSMLAFNDSQVFPLFKVSTAVVVSAAIVV